MTHDKGGVGSELPKRVGLDRYVHSHDFNYWRYYFFLPAMVKGMRCACSYLPRLVEQLESKTNGE
jgi:hypothetical protein